MLKYQIIHNNAISVLITSTLITYINCNHISKNNSDVIITYAGHAEANMERKPISRPKTEETSNVDEYLDPEKGGITQAYEEEMEDVIFVPNEKEVRRIEDESERDLVNISDVMTKQTVDRLVNKKIEDDTERPNEDILFISGKNNENVETENKRDRNTPKHSETRRSGTKTDFKPKVLMNCKNLDCNNTVSSVCGGKIEHKKWRYRLFLNECFFRKVNCGFSYAENRYLEVPIENCRNIGTHLNYRPYVYNPLGITPSAQETPIASMRRSPSRRALNKGIDGNQCSHLCPVSCPDDYNPECAISNSGHRKVFVNHCKLDYNSCIYSIVWHRRPLSECVGNKKADVQQNRAFIAWMQKVGIVNEKGRLMLHR